MSVVSGPWSVGGVEGDPPTLEAMAGRRDEDEHDGRGAMMDCGFVFMVVNGWLVWILECGRKA